MTKVLLVEDNLMLLESIAFELEMRGFTVWQANDGKNALQLLHSTDQHPDIIVSDIAMPEMDGYKLLETIRQNEDLQNIPVIFLTAFNSPNAIHLGKELGIDDYLVKPFNSDDLVTAINNKIKRYQQIHQQAERKLDKTRRELLNVISHELFTPLTSVFGGTELLSESLHQIDDEMTHQMLQLVQKGTHRLNRLINRILLIVQINSGQLERTFKQTAQTIELQALLHESWATVENARDLAYLGVTTRWQLPTEKIYVRGVHPFLLAIFEEAIRNAIKFSPPQAQITIQLENTPQDATVTVADNGMGIPADKVSLLWQNFQQIDRMEHEQQSLGLGLALIRTATAQHGGKADITSTENVGTQLRITLPRVATPED
jgi:signal transduction histidine kinase